MMPVMPAQAVDSGEKHRLLEECTRNNGKRRRLEATHIGYRISGQTVFPVGCVQQAAAAPPCHSPCCSHMPPPPLGRPPPPPHYTLVLHPGTTP